VTPEKQQLAEQVIHEISKKDVIAPAVAATGAIAVDQLTTWTGLMIDGLTIAALTVATIVPIIRITMEIRREKKDD